MSQQTIAKPAPCVVQPDNIPAEMRVRTQWVGWRWTWKPPTEKSAGKWDKPPFNPKTGQNARSNDPSTWTSFEEAWEAYRDRKHDFSGIGYMFSGQPGDFAGIDLDDCRDPDTGQIRKWTPEQRACEHWLPTAPDPQQIIDVVQSYAEVSPSGAGVKIIVLGNIPAGMKHGDIEMYRSGRYFTVTGHRLSSCPSTINAYSALAYLHGLFSAKAKSSTNGRQRKVPQNKQTHAANSGNGKVPTLEQALAACEGAANGDKFRRLYGGDITGYTGHSEADAALCAIIAFWSAGNASLIDQVFRRSKLMRDKWDEARGEQTYGERTIDFALEGIGEFYDWAKAAGKLAIASHEVGNLTLVPKSVRRTAMKITVQLEIQKDGKPLDLKKLTDSESNRKAVLKAIVARVGADSATAQQLDAALGLILVEAAQQKERDGDEKSIYEILAEFVPGEIDLQYATEGGRAFSGKLNKVISRQMFVERFTSNMVLQLASTGADAPVSDEGGVLRGQLVSIVERELKVLWGELFAKLRTVEEVDLTDNSPAAVAYRQAIISLWTRLVSMGIHKTPIPDGQGVQIAARNSLALRVRKLEEAAVASGKWHLVQDGFDAYMRIEDGDSQIDIAVFAHRVRINPTQRQARLWSACPPPWPFRGRPPPLGATSTFPLRAGCSDGFRSPSPVRFAAQRRRGPRDTQTQGSAPFASPPAAPAGRPLLRCHCLGREAPGPDHGARGVAGGRAVSCRQHSHQPSRIDMPDEHWPSYWSDIYWCPATASPDRGGVARYLGLTA